MQDPSTGRTATVHEVGKPEAQYRGHSNSCYRISKKRNMEMTGMELSTIVLHKHNDKVMVSQGYNTVRAQWIWGTASVELSGVDMPWLSAPKEPLRSC